MRRMVWAFGFLMVVGSLVFGASCLPTKTFDRRQMLQEIGDIVILPILQEFVQKAQALKTSAGAFCQTPDEAKLKAIQTTWKEAKLAWKRMEVIRFGPAMDLRTRSFVDGWPLLIDGVEKVLVGTETLDVKYVEDVLGSTRRGLVAVEYLIFDREKPSLLRFQEDAQKGGRSCLFLKAMLESIEARAVVYLQAWKPDGGNFVREMVEAGKGSKAFSTLQSPIDQIINDIVYWVENIEQMKLATPLGKKSGDMQPQPSQVESLWAKISLDAMLANLEAVEALLACHYGGKTGTSIYALLVFREYEALAEKLKAQVKSTRNALLAIKVPLQEAIVSEKAKVEAAYEAVRLLKKILATEVSGALGTVLNFTDNDGD